jgi:hypothetical protein
LHPYKKVFEQALFVKCLPQRIRYFPLFHPLTKPVIKPGDLVICQPITAAMQVVIQILCKFKIIAIGGTLFLFSFKP